MGKNCVRLMMVLGVVCCGVVVANPLQSASALEAKFNLAGQTPAVIGLAWDLTSQKLAYSEYHYSIVGGGDYVVIYRDSEQKLLAEKHLSYGERMLAPDLWQANYVSGEEISVQATDSAAVQIRYREAAEAGVKNKRLARQDGLVVDAGFDQVVQQNWESLLADQKIRFDFLAPSRQTIFEFAVQKSKCEQDRLCFAIAPQSWWLRQFVDPIELTYDAETRRLLAFRGLGNIGDATGDYMKVAIAYRYMDAPE